MSWRSIGWLLIALATSACQRAPRTALDFPDDQFPERLSEWHLLKRKGDRLIANTNVVPYDLNSALFSDYAHKFRTVLVPAGAAMRYGEDAFDFPVGTVISKTFYYPVGDKVTTAGNILVHTSLEQSQGDSINLDTARLLETRLLIKTASGWTALPYVWNEAQTEATLALAGETLSLELVDRDGHKPFTYLVPDTNQCAGCHALEHHSKAIEPIGIRARHLNKSYRYADAAENQLVHWQKLSILSDMPDPEHAPRNVQWDDPAADLESRARAYMDVNCGHCHSPSGPANTSGLFLQAQETDRTKLGLCKIPVASGRGSGDGSFDIVPGAPDESILVHRMLSTEPDVAMPELGRSLVHREGVALIREWIESLAGECSAPQQGLNLFGQKRSD
jgi:uncharacterized repeat protein (TIGR03806 family)